MAAKQATFRYGDNIQTCDYTPGSAVDAGTVVVLGGIVGICTLDLPANELGALNIYGGVYSVQSAEIIARGVNVYWDDSANKITQVAGSNKFLGVTLAAVVADAYVDVAHLAGPTVVAGASTGG